MRRRQQVEVSDVAFFRPGPPPTLLHLRRFCALKLVRTRCCDVATKRIEMSSASRRPDGDSRGSPTEPTGGPDGRPLHLCVLLLWRGAAQHRRDGLSFLREVSRQRPHRLGRVLADAARFGT